VGKKQIKIVITDGEKEAKTSINVEDYQITKELHGVSLIDEQVDVLLNEIKKTSKQTAVEWLEEQIKDIFYVAEASEMTKKFKSVYDQAKQMEKEQIEEAWYDGISGGQCGTSEQYFNETYGGGNG